MKNQDIIKYVDQVIDKTDVPTEYKSKLENELIRNMIAASDDPGMNSMEMICSTEKLARELTRKYNNKKLADDTERCYKSYEEPQYYHYPPPPPHGRCSGNLMLEHNNMSLKLLFIPLLQISSGTERMTTPLD